MSAGSGTYRARTCVLRRSVPTREVPAPFMTILRERSFQETSVENLPFRSNFIYYVDQVLYAIQDLPDDKRPLKFNLKWDEAEQSRTKVQYFVSQAVLQAAVEAAANGVKRENLSFNFTSAIPARYLLGTSINSIASIAP